ncbi:hypothetical protein AGMMS50268_33850 [Spirochaetia bacterium]|nr:hypothetical protein AGMMS50268_33850 [Spirochaetia bacterium]
MAKEKKKYWLIASLLLFIIYIFAATQPIPEERILIPRWLSSLESGLPVSIAKDAAGGGEDTEETGPAHIPFYLGNRFGYVDDTGGFALNRILQGNLSISGEKWAEYSARAEYIDILDPRGEQLLRLEQGRGYPLFLDNRSFLIADEQNTLSALDDQGNILWTYDFAAPLTCIDAAAGLILTGSLDGVVEVLDSVNGKRVFSFEPGGSRLAVILGCSISRDGSRLGIISGIDDQRFLLLERFGSPESGEYKVSYHEFLEDGFRRAVRISFINDDNRIVFERGGGLSIYELNTRTGRKLSLEGEIAALDTQGSSGLLFVITSQSERQKRLVIISLPGTIIVEAPFKSSDAFLERRGSRLYLGGGSTLASFELGRK